MAYTLPETVGLLLLQFFYLVLSLVILFSYMLQQICYKNCHGVNSCFHSILKRTKIVKRVSETTTEFYGFLIEENSIMNYYLVWYIIWILFGAAIVFLDVLLIDVTSSCNPSASRTDCFLNTGLLDISNLYDEPIDCKNQTSLSDKVTFVCYKYTLNLGGAFGVAGGYFATGIMFLNLIGACYGKQTRCCNIVGFIHMVVGTLLSLTALLVVTNVPTFQPTLIEGSFVVLFQLFHILFSLMLVHFVFIIIMAKQRKNQPTYIVV